MPRIRTIKPEFPQSESVGRLSRDARLLFILLWTICDDTGRARASSRMLASLLYPYDNDAPQQISEWLDELDREDCLKFYRVDGNTYLQVTNWLKHQKIDKPSPSRFPEFVEASRIFAKPRERSSGDLGPRTVGPRIKDLPVGTASRSQQSPLDLAKQVWDTGVAFLKSRNIPERQARSVIGKWRKEIKNDDAALLAAFVRAETNAAVEPISFITAILKGKSNGKLSGADQDRKDSLDILEGAGLITPEQRRDIDAGRSPMPAFGDEGGPRIASADYNGTSGDRDKKSEGLGNGVQRPRNGTNGHHKVLHGELIPPTPGRGDGSIQIDPSNAQVGNAPATPSGNSGASRTGDD